MTLRYPSLADVPAHLIARNNVFGTVPTQPPKRSKYRSQPTVVNGERFDSHLEARCASCLDLRWRSGEIIWYTRQVPFRLEGGVVYRADFVAALSKGGVEVIDATGFLTATKKNKLRQMKARYSIDVVLWTDKR